MGRPSKPVRLSTRKIGKEQRKRRLEAETALSGASDKLDPPEYLTAEEKAVYEVLVAQLKPAGILSNVDIFLLVQVSTAAVRLKEIEDLVRGDGLRALDKNLIRVRRSYQKDFERGFRELGLSQNTGAMLTKLADQVADRERDPVLRILKDEQGDI